jgi:hypothetical protein
MRVFILAVVLLSSKQLFAEANESRPLDSENWARLIDPSLSQWDTYLSYRFKSGYSGDKPQEDPIGLNQPQGKEIFSTHEENGETVLKITGEIYGALISKKTYRNYHFKLKVRWGDKKWPPRTSLLKDSGILYHSVGPYGADYWRSWMLGQELQIMRGHMGDYWSQITSAMDVRAFTPEYIMNPVASTSEPFLSVGFEQGVQGLVIRSDNYESPNGEWTDIELICFEGKSLHIVNGHVVMVLANSRYKKDGAFAPLEEGKIQIQSEAAEVFYKDIEIQELDALSQEYSRYFD